MVKLLNEILRELPQEHIASVEFEGAQIVIYTKSIDFLFDGREKVKTLVSLFKKRIELRSDNSLLLSEEETKKYIRDLLEDVGEMEFKFDFARSKLILETENVGAAIGQKGSNLKKIQRKTRWSIEVRRIPRLRSRTVDAMRSVEFQESEYRRKFLNKVGRRIYGGWRSEKIKSWARVTMLGGANQIGRSAVYLQTQESRVLFDCGINPSVPRGDINEFPYLDAPEFKLEDIDAIVLSHAHMDHCGLIPYLYKMGYKGPLYCTEPTRDLCALSLLDCIKLQENTPQGALYKAEDIKEMLKHIIPLNYTEVTDITPDIRLTFYNAGHILGSALCHANIGNGFHNFMYSGDFNFSYKQRLLNKAETTFPRLETFLMECTNCGPKDFAISREEGEEEFFKILVDAYVRSGKVIIPVFGIGRSQEMLLTIEKLISEKRLPQDVKIYVDGMVGEVNAIHTTYSEFLHYSLRNRILRGDNPFLSPQITHIRGFKEREKVFEEKGFCIILATPGMINGGSSLEYLKKLSGDENNALIFVGYQAEGSIGRRIKDGEKEILLENSGREDDKLHIKLKIYEMKGAFSGHSDVALTKKFVSSLTAKPSKIILNHGEPSKIEYFSYAVKRILPNVKSYGPENMESIRLK